ncbi:hypothetical protein AB0M95_15545 [Sphaerisporangium sp. NPDC051017]|uniref:hypothetical protein n=1 Tax=Sphaerisporangium sp. NPDC051017 TaxID=3154636 RepID=UPI0034490161
MAIDEIAVMRADAERLRAALNAHVFPDDETLRAVRDRVERHAVELVTQADEPITIGVVGAFSVGKSMLIGTLLGRPDLLPTEQRATTGNVTALYLKPGEPGARTEWDELATVTYMTVQELTDCVRDMLGELALSVKKIFPDADVTPLQYDPIAEGWARLEHWCRTQVWAGAHGNIEHRKIAVELLALRDAHLSGPGLLGQRAVVVGKLIREAVDLGADRPVPGQFPPRSVRSITLEGVARDGETLRAGFPLVKRVSYQVRVDPLVWPLDGLSGRDEVVLLDFPGLDSRRSALRDEYLSRTELGVVHTIITVIDAGNPSTSVPDRFYGMLQRYGRDEKELRDYILVAGNRFDLVPAPAVGVHDRLTFPDLRAASQKLAGLSNTALALVQDQAARVRLVSSPVAMSKTGLAGYFPGEEGQKVQAAVAYGPEAAEAWGKIAARLTDADPADPWAASLAAFAEDGGMRALRTLIEDHARTHGLRNKLLTMRAQDRRMREALVQLERLLLAEELTDDENSSARQLVEELFNDFRLRHQRVAESLKALHDPAGLRAADGAPLVERIRTSAVTEVMRWPEWQAILQRSHDGFIPKTERAEPPAVDWFLDEDDLEGDGSLGNETTATFFDSYADVLRAAATRGRRGVEEAALRWIESSVEQLGDLKERLGDPEVARLLDAGLPKLGRLYGAGVGQVLTRLADLSWMAKGVKRILEGETPVEDVAAGYPLYLERALPWHADVHEGPGDVEQQMARHQVYVFRLQRELCNGLTAGLTAQVNADVERLHGEMLKVLQTLWQRIPGPAAPRLMFPPDRRRPDDDDGTSGTGGCPQDGGGPGGGASPLIEVIAELRSR